jgi:uncharacterized protein YbbC (DUF1343 family)
MFLKKQGKYKYLKQSLFTTLVLLVVLSGKAQENKLLKIKTSDDLRVGAERMELYLSMIKDKNVGVLGNQSSKVGNAHLVDTLLSLGITVKKVFCPEHGFRGDGDAGELIKNYFDKKTGLPIISLYGNNKKPKASDLKGLDVILFDLQDVGARFYTYISSMHYMMEACAENGVKMIILDRPNPNGFYVDGPILEDRYKSFVGMHKVPVVHGMTVGEYALMINGEEWLLNKVKCDLEVIKIDNYSHSDLYQLPVKPSPNLSTMEAVYLYPSLCFFEGTVVSVGRGTDKPFRLVGHPQLKNSQYTFIPKSIPGASKTPMYEGLTCYGYDLSEIGLNFPYTKPGLNLTWLIQTYQDSPDKFNYFNNFFNNLSGTGKLRQQVTEGLSEEEIKKSWQPGLLKFKQVRKKYLLYEDFE